MSISVRAVKAAALLLILAAATMTAAGHAASRSATATVAAPMTSFVSKEYGYHSTSPETSRAGSSVQRGAAGRREACYQVIPSSTLSTTLRADGFSLSALVNSQRNRHWLIGRATSSLRRHWPADAHRKFRARPWVGAAARSYTFSCSDAYGIGIDAVHGETGYFMVLFPIRGAGRVSSAHRSDFELARRSFRYVGH